MLARHCPSVDVPEMGDVTAVKGRHDPEAVERLLGLLPDRFGVEAANGGYVEAATTLPTYLALSGDEVVGVLLVARHFDQSAEIHLMVVHRGFIAKVSVGDSLHVAGEELAGEGVAYCYVKTLGASSPSPH